MSYDFSSIEAKWQKKWEEEKLYLTNSNTSKEKMYVLDMFPYPSGEGLHVGHPKGYIATDIYSRMKKMQGMEVLHPMGWDAFGLPAEQFALKNTVHPRVAVDKNIARYKEQLGMLGFNYDWSREVNTTDPAFYKWTQWIFKQMWKHGLAHESHEPINWCPSCMTGLSNEDLEDGKCERCGSEVEKKPIRQWVLKITKYADRMLEDLDDLNWPAHIKESQKNWIGKSEGVEFDFKLTDINGQEAGKHSVTVFTTRADTLYGVTFVAISAELAKAWIEVGWKANDEVKSFLTTLLKEQEAVDFDATKEKHGIFTGMYAVNPATQENVPVWIANYVIGGVGTGAIMAVPAHDERDFAFAKKYNLPIKHVIDPYVEHEDVIGKGTREKKHKIIALVEYEGKYLSINWKKELGGRLLVGGTIEGNESPQETALREIVEETGFTDIEILSTSDEVFHYDYFAYAKNKAYSADIVYVHAKLRSLAQKSQALEKTEENNFIVEWINESTLLQEVTSEAHRRAFEYISKGSFFVGVGILAQSGEHTGLFSSDAYQKIAEAFGGRITKRYKLQDWVFARQRYWGEPFPIVFDENHKAYVVADSELPVKLPDVEKYEPTGTGESPLANITEWVEVYGYINEDGEFVSADRDDEKAKLFRRETNTMPQWAGSSWYYLRYIDPHNEHALVGKALDNKWSPVDFYVGGAEHATRHLIYARFWHKFLYDIGVVNYQEPFKRLQNVGLIQAEDGRKMSKRFGNVVNPDDVVREYGADTLRVYEMFMGPFDQTVAWSTKGMAGAQRFLDRVWKLEEKISHEHIDTKMVTTVLHQTIKKVGEDIELFKFNTAISQMMICLNEAEKEGKVSKEFFATFIRLLAPFAPHMTEELWTKLGNAGSIHTSVWPSFDETLMILDEVTIAIQIGGKLRGTLVVARDIEEATLLQLVKETEGYGKYVGDSEPKRVVVVKNKLVNIVL